MARIISQNRVFDGTLYRCEHLSETLGGLIATFSIFIPNNDDVKSFPSVIYLSGLTCTDQNVAQKGHAFQKASELSIAFIMPDTSPRGADILNESVDYTVGAGAGFYVNATEMPWQAHYRMCDYITKELPAVVELTFPAVSGPQSIMGHSMGGHGALTLGLKYPHLYHSISAFAPICNPSVSSIAKRAFTEYFGDNLKVWKEYDACELVRLYNGPTRHILIDQGSQDEYLVGNLNQLQPQRFIAAAEAAKPYVNVSYNLRDGFDHSYYFVSTFMASHLEFHHSFLKRASKSNSIKS